MRPRVHDATAHIILYHQGTDESVGEATERLLREQLSTEDVLLDGWDALSDFTIESAEIRPRINDDDLETTIESATAPDGKYEDTIDLLIWDGEGWGGIDVAAFAEAGYNDSYVSCLESFAEWYDDFRPPSPFDVGEWTAELRADGRTEQTIRLNFFAAKAYLRMEGNGHEESRTRDELVDALRDLRDGLGRTPTSRDILDDDSTPSLHEYQTEFGGWNDALTAAGLELNQSSAKHYSDQELLENLWDFADDLGEIPTSGQMVYDGPHSTSTYTEHFGSWQNALRVAGMGAGMRYEDVERPTSDELAERIEAFDPEEEGKSHMERLQEMEQMG